MKQVIPCLLFIACLLACPGFVSEASAELDVQFDEVRKVAEHTVLVTLTWTVTVVSDRDWEGCELLISFRDARDREVHGIRRSLSLKKGRNTITDHEICETAVWEATRKYSGKLNCGF